MRNKLGSPDDLDPKEVDVAHAPKRRRVRARKPAPMPDNLKPWVDKAEKRMSARPASPGIMLEPRPGGGKHYTSPHDDLRAWEIQVADAFGTRSLSVCKLFTRQLAEMCKPARHEGGADEDPWKPSEIELNAMLAIINGVRPRNEIEAMQTAQMCAVHMMHMRLSACALGHGSGWVDEKTAAIISKLSRTFSLQAETLLKLKGRRRTVRQVITVVNEKHVHNHQHVHVEGGGPEYRGQSHEASEGNSVGKSIEGTCKPAELAPVRSEDTGGNVVPLPRDARPGALSGSRGQGRRSEG